MITGLCSWCRIIPAAVLYPVVIVDPKLGLGLSEYLPVCVNCDITLTISTETPRRKGQQ